MAGAAAFLAQGEDGEAFGFAGLGEAAAQVGGRAQAFMDAKAPEAWARHPNSTFAAASAAATTGAG